MYLASMHIIVAIAAVYMLLTAVEAQDCEDPGYYKDEEGNVQVCPVGHRCPINTCEPIPCAPGQYQAYTGYAYCQSCFRGKYQFESGKTFCYSCPAGSYQPNAGQTSCLSCPAGSFQDSPGQPDCKACSPGSYSGTTGRNYCYTCLQGLYQDESGARSCKLCPAGHFFDSYGATNIADCAACSPGTYQDEQGGASCKSCLTGTYADGSSAEGCAVCDKGKYQDQVAQSACKLCGTGTYSAVTGATTINTCVACQAGSYQDQQGQSSCKLCLPGSVSSARAKQCTVCEPGTFQSNQGQSSCNPCTQCPPGFTVTIACTNARDTVCADVTPPVLVLTRPDTNAVIEDDVYEVEGSLTASFVLPLASATDTAAGAVIIVSPSAAQIANIDITRVSRHQKLTFKAIDANENTVTRTITVVVKDSVKPVLSYSSTELVLEAGMPLHRRNLTYDVVASDNLDGTYDSRYILVEGMAAVDTSELGSYTIQYTLNITDNGGNHANALTRTIYVQDRIPPVLRVDFESRQVLDGNLVLHEAATPFVYPIVYAVDNFDRTVVGNRHQRQETPSKINPNSEDGTLFLLRISVKDKSGNEASETFSIEIRDTTKPVIQIIGGANLTHEAGSPYEDQGATATDTLEDALRRHVSVQTVANNVNIFPPQIGTTYAVVYEACDGAGNCGTAERHVTLVDTTPPVLSLLGPNPFELEAGQSWETIPGVIANDSFSPSDRVLVSWTLQEIDDDHLLATYTATDESNNMKNISREIVIVDTTPPMLRLAGPNPVILRDGNPWIDPGVEYAFDIRDKDVRGNVNSKVMLVRQGTVDNKNHSECLFSSAADFTLAPAAPVWTSPLTNSIDPFAPSGTIYLINITVSDAAGNVAHANRTVHIVDTELPRLTLLGDTVLTLEYNELVSNYQEAGAVAEDSHDGDISGRICIDVVVLEGFVHTVTKRTDLQHFATGAIARAVNNDSLVYQRYGLDIVTTGSVPLGTAFVLSYSVTDRSDHAAEQIHRVIYIIDTTPPVLELRGNFEVTVPYATQFREPGFSAHDTHDGDITERVVVTGIDAVNVRVAATYLVRYTVQDTSGNTQVAVRRVVVKPRARPLDDSKVVVADLAGSASDIFQGDLSALEQELGRLLQQDYVIVFLIYDKAHGRASQQDLQRRADVSSTNAITVFEFGVRNTSTLEWLDAAPLAAKLAVSSSTTITVVAADTLDERLASSSAAGSNFPLIFGTTLAALLLVAVLTATIITRRKHKHSSVQSATIPPYSSVLDMMPNPAYRKTKVGEETTVQTAHAWNEATYDVGGHTTPRHEHPWSNLDYDIGVKLDPFLAYAALDVHGDQQDLYEDPKLEASET
eukprot:m.111176 g.111176  ORF g.111176 m.111176 type:complete len:1347 (+) comp15284_c1_seq9:262-4302(+)